jgi:hypothetical protein
MSVLTVSPLPHAAPALRPSQDPWLTAVVRPAGTFNRSDTHRLGSLLDPLATWASLLVVDLAATRLSGPAVASVLDAAALQMESRGACLLCINVDALNRTCLARAGDHALVVIGVSPAQRPGLPSQPEHSPSQREHSDLTQPAQAVSAGSVHPNRTTPDDGAPDETPDEDASTAGRGHPGPADRLRSDGRHRHVHRDDADGSSGGGHHDRRERP